MSMKVRPVESAWAAVVALQQEKLEEEAAKGVKRFAASAVPIPPDNGPRNYNDPQKLAEYARKYKSQFTNGLEDFFIKSKINKKNVTKLLNYLA